ncbi:MAG: tyrosine-type recombinase/integrase [Bryobacteraceae bacterium]
MTSAYQPPILKCRTLAEAGETWLTRKVQERKKPKTIECCRSYLRALLAFFGDTRLYEIDAGSLIAYQSTRSKAVGPSAANHEINALAQIMRLAGCWGRISDSYKPLKEKEWQKPNVFTPHEQELIFSNAKDDPELELAEIAFTIMRNAGVGASELRRTRLRDVDLNSNPPTYYVARDGGEFDVIPRLIPLSPDAQAAFRRAIERANKLGARYREQFIFPLRVNRTLYDPTKPASKSWLRHQTRVLRERTGINRLNPQVWRHQLCTEMLEQGVPSENLIGVLGRVSENMLEAYKHTSLRAKQEALGMARANIIAFPGQRSVQR